MWRFLRSFRTAHQKVDDFRQGRTRQPDHEFFAACGVEPGTETARIALAVRRAVAGIGLVDPLFVRPEDSYPGALELLPLWDSMDFLALQFEIEQELGHKVQWRSGEFGPKSWPLTVSDMVSSVRDLLAQTPAAEPGAGQSFPHSTSHRPRGR